MPEREGTLWVINYLSDQLSTALPIFYNFKGKIKKKKKKDLPFRKTTIAGQQLWQREFIQHFSRPMAVSTSAWERSEQRLKMASYKVSTK